MGLGPDSRKHPKRLHKSPRRRVRCPVRSQAQNGRMAGVQALPPFALKVTLPFPSITQAAASVGHAEVGCNERPRGLLHQVIDPAFNFRVFAHAGAPEPGTTAARFLHLGVGMRS